MRKTVIILFVLQSFLLNAQEPPKMLKYNAKNAANIFYYQINEIPEEIKVKEEKRINSTKNALRAYNNKIKKISFVNFQKLNELETEVNTLGNQARTNADIGRMLRKNIEIIILPLRDSISKFEKKLNGTLEVFLSKRQYKKWTKYQRNQKRKLLPERPKSRSTAPPTNRRQRRGGGRRRNGF